MTENQIIMFNNEEFGEIRTLNIDGEPWFVGKDIAEVLEYSNTRKAIADHVDNKDKTDGVTIRDSIGRPQNPVIINESELYSLIIFSHMPGAEKFRHWITSEVIPSIRKTGGYIEKDSAIYNYIKAMEQSITVLQNVNSSMANRLEELNEKISAVCPVLNQKKINIWKSKFIKPRIDMIVRKYGVDERSAYDLVYDRMSSRYGFDRSCAINEFCDKYKTEICYVTDAIADHEPYRRYFVDCVGELLGSDDPEFKRENFVPDVHNDDHKKVKYNEEPEKSFNEIVDSLEAQNKDGSDRGIGTLGKIYKIMMSDRDWKQIMQREHCYSKKQLILNDKKLFDSFKTVVLGLLGGNAT